MVVNAELSNVITYLAAIAIAAERLVEMTKATLPFLSKVPDKFKVLVYHSLALIFSGLIIYYATEVPTKVVPWYVLALITASGSGVLNTMVQTMNGLKDKAKDSKDQKEK